MKHLYFLSILIVCFSIARAQVNKGDIVLGGNIGYSGQSSTTNSNNSTAVPPGSNSYHNVSIDPSIGKAIRSNLVLGIDLFYLYNTSSYNGPGQSANSVYNDGYGAGVFLRRYRPLGNGFYLFGQARLSLSYSHDRTETPSSGSNLISDRTEGYGAGLQLYPGISYALNHHWQIETGLPNFLVVNYNYSRDASVYTGQVTQTNTGHYFNFSSSLTGNNELTVGVRYFIGE